MTCALERYKSSLLNKFLDHFLRHGSYHKRNMERPQNGSNRIQSAEPNTDKGLFQVQDDALLVMEKFYINFSINESMNQSMNQSIN